LGISSWHLKESGRGFSFQKDEPLDMRADPNLSVTAADLLNGLTKNELKELFQKYGEEERAPQLAAAVVRARSLKPFRTTADLVGVAEKVGRTKDVRRDRIHPATKIFQALRIAVNDEVENLRSVLPRAFEVLGAGGRLVVVSFHSLEDREVKRFFQEMEAQKRGTELTKKPVPPTAAEVAQNPQSRSARLRVIERK
jgi:16S rRNA (cytosine1402-N4)-methyltransferase